MPHALDLRDVCFRYGRRETVRGVSLSLGAGDCYGFLGHNGAGKTTVLRLCLGLLPLRRGSVRIFGVDALAHPRPARATVGALVERPGFHAAATALQNLVWLARLQGLPRRPATAEGRRALELLGLSTSADRRVGTFSLGMRQRLGVAQALLGRPRLLLLDEPANGLDPEGIADLRQLLRHLSHDEGVAVLLSSHQLQELEGLCNRIGVLREGSMVVEGDIEALRAGLHAHHVVAGTPLPAFAARLTELGLPPRTDGDRLLVDLAGHRPGSIARELAAAGELHTFAPAPVTLEAIYLQATKGAGASAHAAAGPTDPAATPPLTAVPRPRWRAFGHELRTLVARPTTSLLLLTPCLVGTWNVLAYRRHVDGALLRVHAGELFSADAGSGHVATARALQAATPVLAAALLWFASQSVAADFSRDTLRNTLVRSVVRGDVLLGKLGALATLAVAGWAALVLTTLTVASATLGLGDLDEVSRYGDRQVLAAVDDVAPVMAQAIGHCVLPLLALTAVGLLASALAQRPARALALALLCVLGPELLRGRLRDHSGWLLSSHLPTGLRDDSVLGYLAAVARGAADASWPWSAQAILAPLAWCAVATFCALVVLRRLRVP